VRGVSGNVSFTVIIFLIQTFTLFFFITPRICTETAKNSPRDSGG